MAKTLNKNGKPRKTGSGKTKGAGCYEEISWAQLKKVIAEDVKFPVSRLWLKNIGLSGIASETNVKKHDTAVPKGNSELPKPKVIRVQTRESKMSKQKSNSSDSTYDPPPLFASGDISFDQF